MGRVFGLLVAVSLLSAATAAQQPFDKVLREVEETRRIDSLAIAPDGHAVAWVESGRDGREIVWARSANRAAKRLGTGRDVSWSPDNVHVAFISAGTLYVADASRGAARPIGAWQGYLSAPGWSPDGHSIAVLYVEDTLRGGGPLEPVARQTGEIEEHVPIQRLVVISPDDGSIRAASPAGLHIYEFDWAPDSKHLAAVAAAAPGNANWWIAALYLLDPLSGQGREILRPSMQIGRPRWSPDGSRIAFIGGLMSDEVAVGGDVYSAPAAGGEATDLTSGLRASANHLWWTRNGLVFTAHVDGGSGIYALGEDSPRSLWRAGETIRASVANDGRTIALIRQSFNRPPEVWMGTPPEFRPVTHVNTGRRPVYGEGKSLHWRSGEFQVQGWLLAPPRVEPGRKYPLIVAVHGGPAGDRRPFWPSSRDFGLLSTQGYFVFEPNPRGSYGEGEAFTRANVKDFGGGDLRDILRGVDEVLRTAPVDPNRVGITGWSYGGFMTMWAVTQTRRFRAAVAGAGISDWRSYYGENSINAWMIPYFGASVYDDPQVYAKSDPIEFIKQVKTPTLVLVGESDAECPAPQSFEFWRALKTLGVKTRLVVYEDEGHGITQPEHRQDILERTRRWFNENMP